MNKTDLVTGMGRTNERVGRIQETYVTQATQSWLESLDRSLAQMKDYQVHLGPGFPDRARY